ncbi:WecB/TagA/CpsF family glycosyltransferase [Calothrix rhizosoleniae]|uniref:WecB/TagA/CpsF family glycosyltransferase n=1 Tax=Calothrix rhizosoleniae TaxID=888997 RepID=UPI000B49A89D|nr:WecB/TagA/CpsF family glycosyltransferase [Calothrix rhizosoleniae]
MKRSPYKILGVEIDALSIPQLHDLIAEAIDTNKKWIIANHNMHSLYLYHHDQKVRAFYAEADYVHIDSMPLVFIAKLLGFPIKREQRVTYADWIWPLMAKAAENNWRVFYLGSKPGVAEKGAARLRLKFPNLQIKTAHGYINLPQDSHKSLSTLETISKYQPHILIVGMGMPQQEHWILKNLPHIKSNTILTGGACIDYVAGAVPTPPRWMGKVGLEWLYRLLNEPKRLWKRYLIEPWFITKLLLKEVK